MLEDLFIITNAIAENQMFYFGMIMYSLETNYLIMVITIKSIGRLSSMQRIDINWVASKDDKRTYHLLFAFKWFRSLPYFWNTKCIINWLYKNNKYNFWKQYFAIYVSCDQAYYNTGCRNINYLFFPIDYNWWNHAEWDDIIPLSEYVHKNDP